VAPRDNKERSFDVFKAGSAREVRGGGEEDSMPPLINIVCSIYIGFFGILLLARPGYFFGGNGLLPHYNVEEFSPLETYYARMDGVMFTAVATRGLFAPKSVVTTRILALVGTILTALGVKMAYYTADTPFLTSTWTPQLIVNSVMVLWAFARCFADRPEEEKNKSVGLINLFTIAYAGLTGLSLLANPSYLYGEKGLVPFFTETAEFTPLGTYFARALGGTLFAMAAGTFLFAAESSVSTKTFTVASALTVPLFIKNLLDKSGTFIDNGNWNKQITTNVVLTAILYYLSRES
jgi:hypothetical protein